MVSLAFDFQVVVIRIKIDYEFLTKAIKDVLIFHVFNKFYKNVHHKIIIIAMITTLKKCSCFFNEENKCYNAIRRKSIMSNVYKNKAFTIFMKILKI